MRQGSPFCCSQNGERRGNDGSRQGSGQGDKGCCPQCFGHMVLGKRGFAALKGICQGFALISALACLRAFHPRACSRGTPFCPGNSCWFCAMPFAIAFSRSRFLAKSLGLSFFFDLPGVGTRAFSRAWRRQADGARLRLLPQAACPRARSRTTACQASWRWAWSCRAQPG